MEAAHPEIAVNTLETQSRWNFPKIGCVLIPRLVDVRGKDAATRFGGNNNPCGNRCCARTEFHPGILAHDAGLPDGLDGFGDMNRNFPEELISAYLDGRVTADERIRVEEALAGSAELRRLHSDLQRVQSGLRQLPRVSLPADFADRVIQRIEKNPLHRSAPLPAVAEPAVPAHTQQAPGHGCLRGRAWR